MSLHQIDHLFQHPQHRPAVAAAIYKEFWKDKPGYSPAFFENLLRQADHPDRIPLCLVARVNGQFAGVVNLIENDNAARPHWRPWLAALIVLPPFRGQGIGSALVRRLVAEGVRLGYHRLHLGTDAPGFYERLGARQLEWLRPDLALMAIDSRQGQA